MGRDIGGMVSIRSGVVTIWITAAYISREKFKKLRGPPQKLRVPNTLSEEVRGGQEGYALDLLPEGGLGEEASGRRRPRVRVLPQTGCLCQSGVQR